MTLAMSRFLTKLRSFTTYMLITTGEVVRCTICVPATVIGGAVFLVVAGSNICDRSRCKIEEFEQVSVEFKASLLCLEAGCTP